MQAELTYGWIVICASEAEVGYEEVNANCFLGVGEEDGDLATWKNLVIHQSDI